METLPDIDDDITPGLSILYAASENDPCLSGSKQKLLGGLPNISPNIVLKAFDETKEEENIKNTDLGLHEIKGKINGPLVQEG